MMNSETVEGENKRSATGLRWFWSLRGTVTLHEKRVTVIGENKNGKLSNPIFSLKFESRVSSAEGKLVAVIPEIPLIFFLENPKFSKLK
jgi:hypothetical protein